MTKCDLQRIRSLKKSIACHKRDAKQMQNTIDQLLQQQTDTVQGSGASYPYILRPVKISGIVLTAVQKAEYDELLDRLANIKDKLQTACKAQQGAYLDVMDWLTTVEPCDLREALALHYVDGKSWAMVASEQNRTVEAVKQQVQRFFK